MSVQARRITKEQFLIGTNIILGLFIAATLWALSAIQKTEEQTEETWQDQLKHESDIKLEELTTWLNIQNQPLQRAMASQKLEQSLSDVKQLSSEKLRSHPFADDFLNELTSKYNLDNAYLFDEKHRLVGRSRGAQTLDQLVKQQLATFYRQDKTSSLDFYEKAGEFYILGMAKIIKENKPAGYVSFTKAANDALADMESTGVSRPDIEVYIARKSEGHNPIVIRWPLPFKFSKITYLKDSASTLPFFERSQNFGVYTALNGEAIYAQLDKPSGFPNWQIATQLATDAANVDARSSKIWIFGLLGLIYIVLGVAEYVLFILYNPKSNDKRFRQAEKMAQPVAQQLERLQILARRLQKKKALEKAHKMADESNNAQPAEQTNADTQGNGTETGSAENIDVIPEPQETEEQKQARELAEELQKTNMVKDSLKRERIRLFYQPIVDRRGKAAMYETLIRVLDEQKNLMAPAEFFPLAKKYHFLDLIDDTVLVASIRKHIQLLNQGERTVLCLNLSKGAFSSERFMNVFMEGLSSGQVHPEYLVFEVESQEVISDDASMSFIRELKRLGCRFSIDYLGGGEKSIHAAKQLGFNNVKISALKFQDMATNSAQMQEFSDIIRQAQNEGLTVIVEKIETEFVWQLCKTLDVDYVQGFYIAKPDDKINLGWKEKNYADPKGFNQIAQN